MTTPNREDLRQMPITERLRLMEDLWASLSERPDALDVPTWHREELDARLTAHNSNASATLNWSDIKAELASSLRK